MNPLSFEDRRGNRRVEPAVSGTVDMQTVDPVNPDLINDLIVLSPFRSGVPLTLPRNRQLSAIRALHDPDSNGDHGVALCEIAKRAFADPLFSAADILTCRVGHPTPSTHNVKAGATVLGTITTGDYGSHTLRSRVQISRGTLSIGAVESRKIYLADDVRKFGTPDKLPNGTTAVGTPATGDSLGILMTVQYTGRSATAVLTIRKQSVVASYTKVDGQGHQVIPEAANNFEVNGVVFGWVSAGLSPTNAALLAANGYVAVSAVDVRLKLEDTADATWAHLVDALNDGNVAPGVIGSQNTAASTVTLVGLEVGVAAGAVNGAPVTLAATGDPTALRILLHRDNTGAYDDNTDGSLDLIIPLGLSQFSTLQALQAYINAQVGYSATLISGVNKFLSSTAFDVVANVNAKAAPVALTGYMAALSDWVNTRTQRCYTMAVAASGEPDTDDTLVYLKGGSTPPTVEADWEGALTLVGTKLQLGGIVLLDTDDPSMFQMCDEWIQEQASRGRWFRGYYGTRSGLTETQILEISAAINSVDSHVCCQRASTFGANDTIVYLDPVFTAAAMAGGAAGNRPWVNPLTMKQTKFIGIHPDDDYSEEMRESLESGGITTLKTENGIVLCAFDVTTSLNATKRMPRITSEVAVIKLFESNLQAALAQYRGSWAGNNYLKRVTHTFQAIASDYEAQGALTAGVDDHGAPQNAWELGEVTLYAGVLHIEYGIWIAGEVSQIDEHGVANYQRLVAVPTT